MSALNRSRNGSARPEASENPSEGFLSIDEQHILEVYDHFEHIKLESALLRAHQELEQSSSIGSFE